MWPSSGSAPSSPLGPAAARWSRAAGPRSSAPRSVARSRLRPQLRAQGSTLRHYKGWTRPARRVDSAAAAGVPQCPRLRRPLRRARGVAPAVRRGRPVAGGAVLRGLAPARRSLIEHTIAPACESEPEGWERKRTFIQAHETVKRNARCVCPYEPTSCSVHTAPDVIICLHTAIHGRTCSCRHASFASWKKVCTKRVCVCIASI